MSDNTYLDEFDVPPAPKEEVVDPAQSDFFRAHARPSDPHTSHDAARSLSASNLRDSQKAVLGQAGISVRHQLYRAPDQTVPARWTHSAIAVST